MISSKVLWSVPKSYVQVAKFSSYVFLWHERSMTWALHVVNTGAVGRREILRKVNIKKTRSTIPYEQKCLTYPHHFSKDLLWKKRCLRISWFQWLFRPTHLEPGLELGKWVFFGWPPSHLDLLWGRGVIFLWTPFEACLLGNFMCNRHGGLII